MQKPKVASAVRKTSQVYCFSANQSDLVFPLVLRIEFYTVILSAHISDRCILKR